MVMSRSTAVGSIVTGSIMLLCVIVAVICGAITSHKLSGEVAASAGLWSLYFGVPGILCIVAGATKNSVVMGVALCFDIFAVVVSVAASIVLLILSIAMSEYVDDYASKCIDVKDKCYCGYSNIFNDNDDYYSGSGVKWDMKCSDLNTLHTLLIAALVVYVILAVTSFTASIFGCLGTCCAPVDPVVVVATGAPCHTGGTVVVTSNQSSLHTGYPGVVPAYDQMNLAAYGDKSGLVQNMAI